MIAAKTPRTSRPAQGRKVLQPPIREIGRWGLVRVSVDDIHTLKFSPVLIHAADPKNGSSLWVATPSEEVKVGIAFPWAMVHPKILVVSDSMAIVSNAMFFRGSEVASEIMHTAYLTHLVSNLPWHAEVLKQIR